MKLSIIIPTFNSERTISCAINSIISQSFTDWELIIMDGISTDSTIDIVKSYNDSRIHCFSEPDKGVYDAMNKGITKSCGDWLFFLGSDDWLIDDDVLSKVLISENERFDVIYGEVESDSLGPKSRGEWNFSNVDANRCHQCIFYRKDIFVKYHGYDLRYIAFADYALNLRLFADKSIHAKYINLIISHFSDGGISSSAEDKEFYHFYYRYVLLHFGLKLSKPLRRRFLREALNQTSKGRTFYRLLTLIHK